MTRQESDLSVVETERVRRIWQKLAPKYDKDIARYERLLFSGGREWVCKQAAGDVLEIAVGSGRNFEHYPAGIRLTAIDLSPAMLEIARQRALGIGIGVDLRLGDAQALAFPDRNFDTVVSTLALCSIPDDHRAIGEVKRVLRPGGRFLLLEHVRSPIWLVRAVETALDWIAVRTEGDHLVREPLIPLREEAFEILRLERSKWGIVERLAARKPGSP